MQLRPLAPLAVVGAGLLIISLAPRPASATDADAPTSVQVTANGPDLVVSWQAPDGPAALSDYDLRMQDGTSRAVLLDRSVASTHATITSAELQGRSDVVVRVTADFGSGVRASADPVRVSLAAGPAKPETPPALQAAGGVLRVRIPKGDDPAGTAGRVLRVFQDDRLWATATLTTASRRWSTAAPAGHDYSAAYQLADAAGASPFGEQSEPVRMTDDGDGPSGVRISASGAGGGLTVAWTAAKAGGSDVTAYTVRVDRDGTRLGSGYTAAAVRSISLPGTVDGPVAVTVTATDAKGRSSTSTATIVPRD